ncbi:MAG: galactokinase [Ruminiclostridium sp.]|nr:galactokinase [Ruminiclostridium sp.]
MNIINTLHFIENNKFSDVFKDIYGTSEEEMKYQKQRYTDAVKKFSELYPERKDVRIFSASGRTEIGGNHTDHQHGCVLAAAVNLDAIAVVSFHHDGLIRIKSEGYEPFTVNINEVSVKEGKTGTTAIVSGIVARFIDMGAKIDGFDLYCTSDVICGSGISSSAAFEILIGTIIDTYYNGNKAGSVEIAKIGQFAENVYFGKNSGLMDQMVSSVGGLVFIDFLDTEEPKVETFNFDFEEYGYCLCITDTKSSHANLTDDYSAIRNEMENIAKQFGKSHLRFVNELLFYNEIPKLRENCSDRAIIRATHFFEENNRAKFEASALKDGNMEYFLELIRQSGRSSEAYLQNHYSCSDPENQAITLAIMLSRRFLGNSGAVRVHGGGFAGTIQAFVPINLVDDYISEMNRIFGEKSCTKMKIRPVGGIEITKEEM